MKIKKGDHVIVTTGKDKGATGTVIAAYPKQNRVLVQGVNMIKKNTKETSQGVRGTREGGIVTQEAPIHVSNVQLVDPDTKKPARVGYKIKEDGTKVRVLRPSGKEIG
jgi:large subunit ribosomal protein L24